MMGLAESMRKKSLIFSLAMVMKVTTWKRGDGREMMMVLQLDGAGEEEFFSSKDKGIRGV